MLHGLLQTKLHMPATRPVLVKRPRLFKALDAGLAGKLTLISAPAGFGKTTLAAAWLARLSVNKCWLSLNEEDNDPQRFFSYLAEALSPVAGLGKSLSGTLTSAQPMPPQTLVTAMINDLTTVTGRLVLVLDDYQVISNDAIHQAVDLFMEYLPSHVHLLITSRSDPLLSLSRLRARGQITEIRPDDLRFTADEARAFFNQVMGLHLAAGEVEALEAKTEGWVAGLQMAALSIQRMADERQIKSFVEAFAGSHRYIFDYLTDEVLAHQPPHIRDFLLQTSILERFCGPLCDALSTDGGWKSEDGAMLSGHSIIEQLDQANLFMVPLDNQRVWFRYHHLFAELLRRRLRQAQALPIPTLYNRASAWHETHGDRKSAIHYALSGDNPSLAARLLDEAAMRNIGEGDFFALRNMVESLPARVWETYPRLIIAYAWALLFSRQPDAIEPVLARAEVYLVQPGESLDNKSTGLSKGFSAAHLSANIAALRAYRAGWSNKPQESVSLSQEALAALGAIDDEELSYLHGSLTLNLALGQKEVGLRAEAEANLHKAVTLNCTNGRVYAATASFSSLMVLYMENGRLHDAYAWGRRGLDWVTTLAKETGRIYPTEAMIRTNIGRVLYEWNRLAEAHTHTIQALDLVKASDPNVLYVFRYYMFLLWLAQGELDEALMIYDHIGRSLTTGEISNQTTAAMMLAEMAVRLRNLTGTEHQWPAEMAGWVNLAHIQSADNFDEREADSYRRLAWVQIVRGQAQEALGLLNKLAGTAAASSRLGDLIQIHILQAIACQQVGRGDQALKTLDQALILAEPAGYVRSFIDQEPYMTALLKRLKAEGTKLSLKRMQRLDYIDLLLAASGEEPDQQTQQLLADPLSERERDVLRLMPTHLTGPEIARELFISINTYKSHAKNIYSKLRVNGRAAAVQRAQELDLL